MDIGIESAAVEGYFTYEEVGQLKNILTRLRFDPNLVEIDGILEGRYARVERGGYIWGQIKYPMNDVSALPGLFGNPSSDNDYYIRSATQMSEYIPEGS